ncbi:Prolyl 4-hydroxylase 1 [Beauveria bassiana]|nr:Prolyl 4-hydroxylase 1 [Beauveria bassiana]KAH8717300.1 Prolyl 4-hydroxylase 1 [Beauveria bassiana]
MVVRDGWRRTVLSASLGILFSSAVIYHKIADVAGSYFQWPVTANSTTVLDVSAYKCQQTYAVELLSIDPLIIYLDNFVNEMEIQYLLKLGHPLFSQSRVLTNGKNVVNTMDRSSQTAFLPFRDPVCDCLASRMRSLLGNVQHEHVEPLQLVKYANQGDRYRLHTDWSEVLQNTTSETDGTPRQTRRLASIFLYLADDCQGGETYFPFVAGVSNAADDEKYAVAENGEGLLVRPKKGSGIFWNNLHANGSGDIRVTHAGLPVLSGVKIGLNIWSSYFLDSPLVGA